MSDNPAQIGIAIIGAGMIAPTHVAALSDAGVKVRLGYVVSTRPERAQYLADIYAGTAPRFTSNLGDVLNDESVQMVIVATPPSVRIDLITQLANAGKHILLEKPVARNLPEAEQVVEICENAGVKLGVLFQHRMRPASKAAYAFIHDNDLGKLGHVEIAAPLWRDQSYYDELGRGTYERDGGGVMITQAIHTMDLALSFTGAVTRVQAMTATTPLHRMEAEDFAVAGVQFASGAVGSFVTSTASFPQQEEVITLHFEKASLRLGKVSLDIHFRGGRKEIHDFSEHGSEEGGPVVNKHDLHQGVIEDFVEAMNTNRGPMVTGREALDSHRLITAIETSARTGRIVEV